MEQLIALNDEMAALVRAGIPLERGLAALGGEMPRQPGKLAEQLAHRMAAGESLSAILSNDEQFPPVWRAVVEAGLRSGHLASALESLSSTARRVSELRRLVGAGLIYPLIVVLMAYLLFLFLVTRLVPAALQAHVDLTGTSDWVLLGLHHLGRTVRWWAIPLPLLGGILLIWGWRRSGRRLWSRPSVVPSSGWTRWVRRGTGIRQSLHNSRMATFAEVLALLLEQQVALHEAMPLAADASGDRTVAQAAREVTARLQRGQTLTQREDLPQGFPPLLGWLLLTSVSQHDLGQALRRSAAVYRDRASRAATWTSVYLPILLTVVVGGAATFLCALIAFVPVIRLLYHLTWPTL